jgi:hypothetical protein
MITKYMKPIKVIVKSKRKKSDKTTGIKCPDILQMMNIPYNKIIGDKTKIIVMERTKERIRIGKGP